MFLGQSYLLLLSKNINPYIEYFLYIVLYVFCFMFFYYVIISCIRISYLQSNPQFLDLKFLILAVCLGVFGFFNRYNIRITEYDLKTEKNLNLKIAFISDLHIGDSGINETIMKKTIEKINKENVDLIILGGDIVERKSNYFDKNTYGEWFKMFKSKYGTYGVLGNHEYYGGESKRISNALEEYGNMNILNDEFIEFDDFVLIGREDLAKGYSGINRKSIAEILQNFNNENSKYLLLIDHNPSKFQESKDNNIDLQLSGHTHNGQFFPFNLIVKFFYEKPYGLLDKYKSKLIISSGLSTWRIPIKLMSKPEIVIVNIN